MYKLDFDAKVIKDLKKIDKLWQKKILSTIKSKLATNPYLGKKLVGNLSPYYSYRIGNYRVLYELIENKMIIVVIKINHRNKVYL